MPSLGFIREFVRELEFYSSDGLHVFTICNFGWVWCYCIQDFTTVWIGFAFSIVAGRSTIDNPLFNIINCAGYVVNYLAIGRWDYSRNNKLVCYIIFYCLSPSGGWITSFGDASHFVLGCSFVLVAIRFDYACWPFVSTISV